MYISSHLVAVFSGVVALVLCLLLHNLWSWVAHEKGEGKLVPEVPGGLPIIGHLHLLGGKKSLARTLSDMADKHGSIFSLRLGMHPTVVVTDLTGLRDCFTINDKIIAFRPPAIQGKIIRYNNAASGFAPYSTFWRNIGKLAATKLLSNHRTKMLSYVQESEVNYLIRGLYLQSKSNNKINMSEWIEHVVSNIVTRMIVEIKKNHQPKKKTQKNSFIILIL